MQESSEIHNWDFLRAPIDEIITIGIQGFDVDKTGEIFGACVYISSNNITLS